MNANPLFFDPVIYTGQPKPGPSIWRRIYLGRRCRLGSHTIEQGQYARRGDTGGFECWECVNRNEFQPRPGHDPDTSHRRAA